MNSRNELKWYPDQIRAGHLTDSGFQRRLDFANWCICTCQNNRFLANVVI